MIEKRYVSKVDAEQIPYKVTVHDRNPAICQHSPAPYHDLAAPPPKLPKSH